MSFGAYNDAKQQVRQATDIVDLVGSYMELRSQGHDYVALCPWHNDSRPSLRVNRERQSWKCWVCGIGGDAFSFVMRREGIEFSDALRLLADRAGISLPARGGPAPPPGSARDKQTLLRAAAWAEQRFHDCLLNANEAEPARQYVAARGISAESVRRFKIGFSPPGWQWILDQPRDKEISRDVLQAVGLVAQSDRTQGYYDRFRNRVIFPIHDPLGKTIAFGGRILPGDADANAAKYINSPETMLFSKSEQLYGLDLARQQTLKSRHIMVMEGYTDVIVAVQYGLADVVAVLGTALGERHLRLLSRYVDRVTLVLDGDEAGKRRANDVLKLFLAANLDLRIMTLPDNLDPCDFLRDRGADAFRALQETAPDAIEHKIRVETQDLDAITDTHRAHQALEEILRTLSLQNIDDFASSASLRQQQVVARLARQFGVQERALQARLESLWAGRIKAATTARVNRATPPAGSASPNSANPGSASPDSANEVSDHSPTSVPRGLRGIANRDRELLEILVLEPTLIGRLADAVSPDLIATDDARRIYDFCLQRWMATESLSFAQVMTDIEDADLKCLLAEIDDLAQQKALRTDQTPAVRLTELISAFDRLAIDREKEETLACIQRAAGEPDEQVDKLEALWQLHRQTKCT